MLINTIPKLETNMLAAYLTMNIHGNSVIRVLKASIKI